MLFGQAKRSSTRLVSIDGQPLHDMITSMTKHKYKITDNDEQLMLAYQAGELKAFEILYQRHKSPVYRFILRHGVDTVLAEELVQDIWSSVIKARVNYRQKAKFTTWLYQIARNRLIDHYRAHKEHIQLLDDELEQVEDETVSSGEETDAAFMKIHEVIKDLPFPQRQAFLLHYEAGLSVPEVAEVTQEHKEAVKSKIRYAVQKLKRKLGVEDE